ncbi:MAG: uroporphyrinogen-III C-methyltransferase [candidate division FCPU426 bacterium]
MKQSGKVVLAGAGPGDPDLATVALMKALPQADVVVYDYLANEELLRHAPQAEKICVGKRAGAHSWKQPAINSLLLKLAAKGKTVLRLKGGDPYVFGRGGEEALVLEKAGVPFEVLPGVTSGVAALAYAGIPLTHRSLATAAVFVTGQERSGKPLSAATLRALAKLDATLVFYMATAHADRVCKALIRAGRPPKTPAALVHKGTLPGQKVVTSTLRDLASSMAAANLGAPGLIVIGKVVGLRDKLDWFESKPLFGRRILVTRSREQASRLSEGLRALGAEVLEAPSIRIQALKPSPTLLKKIPQCRWLVLTSANGVSALFENLGRIGLDARSLAKVRIAAIGESTAQALKEHGLLADLVPKTFVAEDLSSSLIKKDGKHLRGSLVILARASQGRSVLPQALQQVGAKVLDLPLYETLADKSQAERLNREILAGHLDWVTFTSSSTVDFFEAQLSPAARAASLRSLGALCLGPITRARAESAGYKVLLESPQASIPVFLTAIQKHAGR